MTLPGLDVPAGGVGQVERAASKDESRPILTGVLLTAEDEGLRLVATDSYRLAVCDLPEVSVLAAGQKVLLPSRALREVERALPAEGEITMRLGERDATFEAGGTRITHPADRGRVPELPPAHPGLVPQPGPRSVGKPCSRRCAGCGSWPPTPRRSASPSRARRCGSTRSTRTRARPTPSSRPRSEGTPLTVAFNPQYLADGVEAAAGDEVVLDTLDALKPAVVRPVDREDYLYLLMPVRVP